MTCKIEDCTKERLTKKSGLCSAHYHRERRGSTYTAPVEAYRNFPSYSKAHTAVRAERGKASEHLCVNCMAPAQHWSLMSLEDAQQDTWTCNKGMWFSTNIYQYSPMCAQDHFDYEKAFGVMQAPRVRRS